jgi:mono/diheme cytochrome c family protein
MIRVPILRLTALLLGLGFLLMQREGATVSVSTAREAKEPDFVKDGLGFVQKHCVGCHGEKKPKADLALHVFRDEATVVKNRKVWHNVLTQVRTGEMPPMGRPRPTAAEIEAFTRSVSEAFARADRTGKPDPGRVTIRRLNRTEYNNTIRDLVGVDFDPTEDFPSDDIGHGFDNIGDVLTLSPVLMERYLAAAESIMQRAIVPDPPKPPVRHVSARYTEPAGANVPQTRFRPVTAKGMLHSLFALTMDGEYTLRVRAYAKQAGTEAVHIALSADGKELKRFDGTATTENDAQVFEAKVPLLKGGRRMGVTFLNEFKNDKEQRTLYVEYIELTGPADTRPPSQLRLLACDGDGAKPKREQTRQVLSRFASKAYRRPATLAEVERLVKLAEGAEARGEKWEAGIQLALQAALVSPKFLFRVELDDRPDAAEAHPIDEFQLAARLSYFLWSSMPDDELFDLAGKKTLTANLDAQVQRMLKDPKAGALVENFGMQWLQLRRLKTFAPDAKLFPNFDDALRSAMMKETELFFQAIVRENRSILDLIDADYTFLNERLAQHYGIVDTNGTWAGQKPSKPGGQPIRGEQFVRVSLPGKERGGLLTQASILTVTSNPTRTSPVKRGRWVLEQLLGTPPPPPPPNVPELAETEKAVLSGSLRQRMEQHRVNPNCANCHARMDPIGFAFENFNAIGSFRVKDGEFPIDPAGTLPDGRSFKGPGELKAILKEKKDLVSRCLTEKLLIYALGRGLEYYDRPSIDRINAALARNEYKFSTLVTEIVRSDPFRLRRGKDGPK